MRSFLVALILVIALQASAQIQAVSSNGQTSAQKVVIVTGVRFSYKLVQKWIDEYNKLNPDVQIVIESRGSSDPGNYDVLAEVYEHDEALKQTREYIYVGRYAVLPVAVSGSEFASIYEKKGLTKNLIQQVYFHNIFADNDEKENVKAPFTVYTRMQKAGVPSVFANYFGFEQKNINGKGIAGSDEHLLKAMLRDSTGISYLPLTLAYDHVTRKPVAGLTVLPVDVDGNGKVNDGEKFFGNLDEVIRRVESAGTRDVKNIPVEYLHLSVNKNRASAQAVAFLQWVNENGQKYLNEFGYLLPEPTRFDKSTFNEFASKRSH
jgi:phosphate transport system substrate-binding protein